MRARMVAIGLLCLGLLGLVPGSTVARQDTSALGSNAAQTLAIQATDSQFILPAGITPGLTFVTFENVGQESRHTFLIRLPGNRTIDELLAPPANPDLPPDWLFEGTFVGFPGEAEPGQTTTALITIEPGLYALLDSFSGVFLADPALAMDATPEAAPIQADGAVDLYDFGFKMPDTVSAGPQIWEITNSGPQIHELMLARSEVADITVDQVLDAFLSESGESDGFSAEQLSPAGGLSWLSPGESAWIEVDLEPGTYIAVCWVFDPEAMMPHAMEGMIHVFTVE